MIERDDYRKISENTVALVSRLSDIVVDSVIDSKTHIEVINALTIVLGGAVGTFCDLTEVKSDSLLNSVIDLLDECVAADPVFSSEKIGTLN